MRDCAKALVCIRALVDYSIAQDLFTEADRRVLTNLLAGILEVPGTPPEKPCPMDETRALAGLMEYCFETGHPWADLPEEKFTGRVMGLLTPAPSRVTERFGFLVKEQGAEAATEWFYRLSQATKDVRLDLAAKDLKWTANTDYGDLEITVNLSKPEKDPRDIGVIKTGETYPKCLLCPENEGFWGVPGHPERANHRIIPIELDGGKWFFQYSPYVYYHQHCIVFSAEHRPMAIGPRTVPRILDFLDRFPHFFLGSNASLPLVGGSILEHDHFQGGRWVFPIQKARSRRSFRTGPVTWEVLRWPLPTLRLRSCDRCELERASAGVISLWQGYDHAEMGILSATEKDGKKTCHNSLSIIGRKDKDAYELDMILRNNRTTARYPNGLFHIRPSRHHIKKENIGLIEAMGLAILPGRLARETVPILEALAGFPLSLQKSSPHRPWAVDVLARRGTNHSVKESRSILEEEIGAVFLESLKDCAVYPDTPRGWKGLDRFVSLAAESIQPETLWRQP